LQRTRHDPPADDRAPVPPSVALHAAPPAARQHGADAAAGEHASAVLVIDRLLPGTERPLQVDVDVLERFSALMAGEGWTAQVSAMAFDRIYARERFLVGRRFGGPELAALSMHLLYCHRYGRAGWTPG